MTDILIIDDDREIVAIMRSYLEQQGYAVRVCQCPTSASKMMADEQPQVVFLDLRMPKLCGWDVLRQYMNLRPSHAPRVVITTAEYGRVSPPDDVRSLVSAILRKPFDLTDLSDLATCWVRPSVTQGSKSYGVGTNAM